MMKAQRSHPGDGNGWQRIAVAVYVGLVSSLLRLLQVWQRFGFFLSLRPSWCEELIPKDSSPGNQRDRQ
jgi:hypothetical protein